MILLRKQVSVDIVISQI